jgi:hypothetical protein
VIQNDNPLGIVRGVKAIARAINSSERRAYHLLQTGILPASKEGAIWVTTVGRLRAFYGDEGAQP